MGGAFSDRSTFSRGRNSQVSAWAEMQCWMCEMALVMQWRTQGNMDTEIPCEFLYVDADAFQKVVVSTPVLAAVVSAYAVHACDAMLARPHLVSDMETGADCDSIIASVHSSIRELVSGPLLLAINNKQNNLVNLVTMRKKSFADLEKEIRSGKCHLMRTLQNE
eukprot:4267299-Amphidinium_carterae.1